MSIYNILKNCNSYIYKIRGRNNQ